MDVTTTRPPGPTAAATTEGVTTPSEGRRIPGSVLVARTTPSPAPADQVTITSGAKPAARSDVLSRANTFISAANLASDATAEIARLVKAVDGIVEQVTGEAVPENRRSVLAGEANGLIDEIRKRASASTTDGVRPLAGDPIRVEVEERLGPALEVLLPDDAARGFDLGNVSFSTKDAILQVVTSVETAKRRFQDLRDAVGSTVESARGVVARLEVADQNAEASTVTLRDVDAALRLADTARSGISSDPSRALGSVGRLGPDVLGLLD